MQWVCMQWVCMQWGKETSAAQTRAVALVRALGRVHLRGGK